MARRKILITYLIAHLFTIGTAFRYYGLARDRPASLPTSVHGPIAGLLAAFFLLLVIEPWLTRRSRRYTHAYLVVQTIIVSGVSLLTPRVDYFSTLLIPLIMQAMLIFTPRIGLGWLAGITLVMASLMLYAYPFSEGLPLIVIMSMAYASFGFYAAVTREAEIAERESQRLLTELQDAHEQLKIYAAQAEEMAVAAERNRLARDLHDSVTQSLYSLTLFTQAARELADAGAIEQTQHNLARIADTAGQALKEMRLLVYELRPLVLEQAGLIEALQHRLDAVEGRSGVQAHLQVEMEKEIELPSAVEEGLYRIVQEALNNSLKHAQATSITVQIAMMPNEQKIVLEVADDGRGFDPQALEDKGGLGLQSIRERVEGLGGVLNVSSVVGQGTIVTVELEINQ